MTVEERRAFLTQTPRTGKVATVRPDGTPHITPVWFVLDGDEVIFTTWYSTVKAHNIQQNPRVAFCVDDERPPFAYVVIEGVARLDPHAGDLEIWTRRLAARYMGEALSESYGMRNAVEGEYLVRLTPTKIIAKNGIAD